MVQVSRRHGINLRLISLYKEYRCLHREFQGALPQGYGTIVGQTLAALALKQTA